MVTINYCCAWWLRECGIREMINLLRRFRNLCAIPCVVLCFYSGAVTAQPVTDAQARSILYQSLQNWLFASSVSSIEGPAESLQQYARKCNAATGINVPAFSCSSGVEVPGQGTVPDGTLCDSPNSLNKRCDPGSRFQVLPGRTSDAVAVAHCRKVGLPILGSLFNDIAVIQYNKANGSVCFYQALTNLPGDRVPAPASGGFWSDGNQHWKSPAATRAINCTGCHDNGGFIRSNYIAQLRNGPHSMPSDDDGYDNKDSPLRYVGADYSDIRSWSIRTSKAPGDTGGSCSSCHRLAVSNTSNGTLGTATDFALRATAAMQPSKTPHGPASPIWMRPGQITYNSHAEATAKKYHDCAVGFAATNFVTPPPGCTIAPLGEPYRDPANRVARPGLPNR